MHIKGVILYNHFVRQQKLTNKYPLIQEGEKIKFLNMRTPNRMSSNVISFMTKLPKELDIHSHLDYDTQFDKAFVEPLTFIHSGPQIGWMVDSYGTQTTLEGLFYMSDKTEINPELYELLKECETLQDCS